MTDTEKLIELLYNCPDCRMLAVSEVQRIATFLISHGVTVRENGEWALEHGSYGAIICPICKHEALLGRSRISINLLYVESNFCPNCGADLRRKNDI